MSQLASNIVQQFNDLQFDFVNAFIGKSEFIINGGTIMNQLQLSITNTGNKPFPLTGNKFHIDLNNFLSKIQFSKVTLKKSPDGWSGQVKHEAGYLPHTGSYVFELVPPDTDGASIASNETLVFYFNNIEVTQASKNTGSWIDVTLSPTQDTPEKSCAFFTVSSDIANVKQVVASWATYNSVIYKSDAPTPTPNQRKFQLYNDSGHALYPNWQSSGVTPVFVVAFQPGTNVNDVASVDYIKDFEIAVADPADESLWEITKVDTSAKSGVRVWEIAPTQQNQNILDANSGLNLNLQISTDAALTPMQNGADDSFSHAYMFINQVNMGPATVHQLPIVKEQAPSLSFHATQPNILQETSSPSYTSKLSWSISDNPANLWYKLTLTHNGSPVSLPKDTGNGSMNIALTKGNHTIDLKLELQNPSYTVHKSISIQVDGLFASNIITLQTVFGGTIYAATPFENVNDHTHWVVAFDNGCYMYYNPIIASEGSASNSSSWTVTGSTPWVLSNRGGFENKELGGYSITQTTSDQFVGVKVNSVLKDLIGSGLVYTAPLSAIAAKGKAIFFDGSKIWFDKDGDGITVPNGTTYGNGFLSVPNETSSETFKVLLKSSSNPHDWWAYDQGASKQLSSSTAGYDHSTPTWMGDKLIFIMNNPKNPTTPVWGLYEHDFSGQNTLITNLFGLGDDTYIAHVEYLSDSQYLLMLDTTGFVWVLDCSNDYQLLTPSNTDKIWNSSSYPSSFAPSSTTYLVSDGKSNALLWKSGYNTMLAAHFF
jgi:hypothetical protein